MPKILKSLIQSDFKSGDHGNFEAVIQEDDQLVHYWRDNSDPALLWKRGQIISSAATGPGCIIQSDFKSGDHGNFEVVVVEGTNLVHYFHDNSDVTKPWQRGQTITEVAGAEGHTVEQVAGWGCIMQSNFGTGEHGNFEVLAEEGRKTVVHYWYPNHDIPRLCPDLIVPWMRMGQQQVIVGERDPIHIASTHKVAQLTGDLDRETGQPTFNRTESNFPFIRGTDLGVSFEHTNGRVCFLFGDTHRVNQTPEEEDLDSIAFSIDTEPSAHLGLSFNGRPPLFPPSDNIDQHTFNVPLDGVSWKGAMYVFFSTCHYNVELDNPSGNDLMGRSILGRSDTDGLNFTYIGEFSRRKFINVSIERGIIDEAAAEITQLAVGTPVLWIWGSGRYRASPIYLAVMPLASIEGLLQPVRYFAGGTAWSSKEDEAVPLFGAGDVGELSVRWNPYLARWLALYNSGTPRGILMHSAPQPWGPWSKDPVMIFDPWKHGGYCHFMHRKWDPDPASPTGFVPSTQCDHVQDDVLTPGHSRDTEWGGEYGPYQITRFATGKQGESSQIWFTMSTWNPYQVMLMTSTITAAMI